MQNSNNIRVFVQESGSEVAPDNTEAHTNSPNAGYYTGTGLENSPTNNGNNNTNYALWGIISGVIVALILIISVVARSKSIRLIFNKN